MDIFNTLKHDGVQHNLKIVKEGDKYLLGCVTCGVTLYNTKFDNLEDLLKAYKTCKDEKAETAAVHIQLLIRKSEDIQSKVKTAFLSFKCGEAYVRVPLFTYDSILNKQFSDAGLNLEAEIRAELEYQIKNSDKMYVKDIGLVEKGKSIIISNDTIKNYENSSTVYVMLVNLEEMANREAECPTAKDVIVLRDLEHLESLKPEYDDEEEDNEMFKEFIYRIENNLFDFSNLSKDDIIKLLKQGIDAYVGYNDYMERESMLLLKAYDLLFSK